MIVALINILKGQVVHRIKKAEPKDMNGYGIKKETSRLWMGTMGTKRQDEGRGGGHGFTPNPSGWRNGFNEKTDNPFSHFKREACSFAET